MSDHAAAGPWTPLHEPVPVGGQQDVVMLVEGQTFCISNRAGDVAPASPHGLFVADTRVISRLELLVDGRPLEPLGSAVSEAYRADLVLRGRPAAGATGHLLVVRRRFLALGLREELELRNHDLAGVRARIDLRLDADFADVFAVKERRVLPVGERAVTVEAAALTWRWRHQDVERRVRFSFHGGEPVVDVTGGTWVVEVPPGQEVHLCWDAQVSLGDHPPLPGATCLGATSSLPPVRRAETWRGTTTQLWTDDEALQAVLEQSQRDVGALRLFDPSGELRPVIAAGAPWFMTLFGRDALLAAWMALPLDVELALGVLEALAALQGRAEVPARDEQPGRILHELRFTEASNLSLRGGEPYYGAVDATPLFVVVLAEAARWGAPRAAVERLLPAADAALAWVERYGDRDGDGYVEYLRATPAGLANQGWKDSWDAVRHADGSVVEAPIALCEVQGYVYAAYRGRAELALRSGDTERARTCSERADHLRAAFHRDFWLPERGWCAMALDAAKQPVASLASNQGHALWSGIVAPSVAGAVAEALLGPTMWTGWGVRTLARDHPAYDPMSYHCGSVWPHDSTIVAAGLARYGFVGGAQRIARGLVDAAGHWAGRLPELFCGLDRDDVAAPVAYPTSCWPQAWAAASPLLLLRTLLGLDPDVPGGVVRVAPHLPEGMTAAVVRGLELAEHRVDLTVDAHGVRQQGWPGRLVVGRGPTGLS